MRLTHQTFSQQIPEFIRDGYPEFLAFVREYYKFLDQTAYYDVGDSLDIDLASDAIIDEFYKTYAKGLPDTDVFIPSGDITPITKREFLRHCKEFYSTKGSVESFEFLFKAFFNQYVSVNIPGDQMLRLSDGRWDQSCTIDVNVVGVFTGYEVSDFLSPGLTFDISNDNGTYPITITTVDSSFAPMYRVSFKRNQDIKLIDGQINKVLVAGVNDGNPIFVTTINERPITVKPVKAGSGWVVGSAISIPGEFKDSFARVTKVSPNSGIQNIEILDYGYSNNGGDTYFCSPYLNVPSKVIMTVDTVATSPTAKTVTLNITEYMDHIVSSVEKTTTSPIAFSSGSATKTYKQTYGICKPTGGVVNKSLTYPAWLASLATITINSGMIAYLPGRYITQQSLISDPYCKIQDSKLYQIFSYLISSEVDEKHYKQILGLIHPAGLARFGELIKKSEFINESRLQFASKDDYFVVHEDDLVASDTVVKTVLKLLGFSVLDSFSLTEQVNKHTTKPLNSTTSFAEETLVWVPPGTYNSEVYFSEGYNIVIQTVYIN